LWLSPSILCPSPHLIIQHGGHLCVSPVPFPSPYHPTLVATSVYPLSLFPHLIIHLDGHPLWIPCPFFLTLSSTLGGHLCVSSVPLLTLSSTLVATSVYPVSLSSPYHPPLWPPQCIFWPSPHLIIHLGGHLCVSSGPLLTLSSTLVATSVYLLALSSPYHPPW
jgi:hypothetical protein